MPNLSQFWSNGITWLSHHAVTPFLTLLHINGLAGNPDEIAGALMIAALQVAIIGLIFRPLETWFPAEKWTDRKLTLVDRNYTVLMLLGIFRCLPIWCSRRLAICSVVATPIPATAPDRRWRSRTSFRGSIITRCCCFFSITRSTISSTTGCIAPSTRCPGGGRCTACIIASAR